MLLEQICRDGHLAVLGFYSLPTPFLFFPPVSWGGVGLVTHQITALLLPFSVRSSLSPRCRPSVAVFFPVSLSGLVVYAVLSCYMWLGGGFCLTSHAAIFFCLFTVVLICIFLMTNDIEHIFTCVLATIHLL